jgi:hypothetical protein
MKIFFGSDQIHGECHQCKVNEKDPPGISGRILAEQGLLSLKPPSFPPHVLQDVEYLKRFYRLCQNITQAYTSAKLTFATDRLIAINGIGRFTNIALACASRWDIGKNFFRSIYCVTSRNPSRRNTRRICVRIHQVY